MQVHDGQDDDSVRKLAIHDSVGKPGELLPAHIGAKNRPCTGAAPNVLERALEAIQK
jgi:hypothetical protein